MKTSAVSKAVLALVSVSSLSTAVWAQTPAPESTLSYNIGVVSEYRYRGLAQSRFDPAVQGGVDYADKSGFYVGAWASTIKWITDNSATKGKIELDLYGGYKFSLGDVGLDVGVLRYQYLNNTLGNVSGFANANTTEVYGAATYGPFTLKQSQSTTNLFGTTNSKGSTYTDLSANFDLGNGFTLTPHVGYQYVRNNSNYSYTDYALTLTKDLGKGISVSASAITVDGDKTALVIPNTAPSDTSKFTGKNTIVLGLKYTF